MGKHASNAFLATRISFVNGIANLCERVGADVREVTVGIGYNPRIGFEFLHAGPGWGGSCLSKDTAALLRRCAVGYDFKLLRGALEDNAQQQHHRIVAKVGSACGGTPRCVHVAIWGLTSRPTRMTCGTRPRGPSCGDYSPTEPLSGRATPAAGEQASSAIQELDVVPDPYDACSGAEVLIILTEWDEFRRLDFSRIAWELTQPRVADKRNCSIRGPWGGSASHIRVSGGDRERRRGAVDAQVSRLTASLQATP